MVDKSIFKNLNGWKGFISNSDNKDINFIESIIKSIE